MRSPSGPLATVWVPTRSACRAGDQLDAALVQLAGEEVVVEQGVGDDHVAGPERVVHLPQQRGLAGALARVRRDGQVVAGARRQRQQHGDPGQREAEARLLVVDLRVGRLVLRGVGHGDVGAVGDEDVPPVPLPRLGQPVLQLLGRCVWPGSRNTPVGRRARALQ